MIRMKRYVIGDKPKRFVIGDIHGRIGALKQVLKDSKFNYKKDKLIVLGDIVDGGPDAKKVVEELMKIDNIVYIIGNHDKWFMDFMRYGTKEDLWTMQGGKATLNSYRRKEDGCVHVPVTHQHFFNKGTYYHVEDNMIFVHGGFHPKKKLDWHKPSYLIWDRELIDFARSHEIEPWDKVFVGHSSTLCHGSTFPRQHNNLWMMDTGAGHCGKLTIMDVDTEEYWQSDIQPSCK